MAPGVGEMVITPATEADFQPVCRLLQAAGLPLDGLEDHFEGGALVGRLGESVVACAALERYGVYGLLRSLAVGEQFRGRGYGQRLTRAILNQARRQEMTAVFLLTETAGNFFPRFGFRSLARDQVPLPVRNSVEFTSACPDSALAMGLELKQSHN